MVVVFTDATCVAVESALEDPARVRLEGRHAAEPGALRSSRVVVHQQVLVPVGDSDLQVAGDDPGVVRGAAEIEAPEFGERLAVVGHRLPLWIDVQRGALLPPQSRPAAEVLRVRSSSRAMEATPPWTMWPP
jgi:hypothetical protein